MKLKELYVFNAALDGRPIVGLPELDELEMAPLLAQRVKKDLVKQGLMLDEHQFSAEGALVAKRIADYKGAAQYAKFGLVCLGLLGGGQGISLLCHPGGDVFWGRENVANCLQDLKSTHPFLQQGQSGQTDEGTRFTPRQVKEAFALNAKNSLRVSGLVRPGGGDAAKTSDDLLFLAQDQLYRFDRNANMLYKMTGRQVDELLQERMCMHGQH